MNERTIPNKPIPTEQNLQHSDDGTLNFRILILSGDELYRDDLGDFIFDLSSLTYHKDRFILDYNHEEGSVLGFVDSVYYDVESGLVGTAHISSVVAGDKSEEVINRIAGGVPYEISPTIGLEESVVEDLKDGETANVNGKKIQGPITIYRNASFRGVAICPYGTDKKTCVLALKLKTLTDKEVKMADETKKDCNSETTGAYPELERLIEAFGLDAGVAYYRAGLSFEEAEKEDYAKLKAERSAKLAAEEDARNCNAESEEPIPEDKKEDQANLSGTVLELRESVQGLSAEVVRLRSLLLRGESDPVSIHPSQKAVADNRSAVMKFADQIKQRGIKR